MLQIESIAEPFSLPGVQMPALLAVGRADAMGLLQGGETLRRLDDHAFQEVLRCIHRAGIARNLQWTDGGLEGTEAGLARTLAELNRALTDSPAPAFEWRRMGEVLGPELLGRLLGLSLSSLRRYRGGERPTPELIAERLHFLCLLVGDLAGAYNEFGIRQWFGRRRAQLEDRAPQDFLQGDWRAGDAMTQQLQALGRALLGGPAAT